MTLFKKVKMSGELGQLHLDLLGNFLGTGVSVRIPVNVTTDSGNVTGIPLIVTAGRCCAF